MISCLLTCKVLESQYTGSTSLDPSFIDISRILNFAVKERETNWKHSLPKPSRYCRGMFVQIIDHCNPSNREKRKNIWMNKINEKLSFTVIF